MWAMTSARPWFFHVLTESPLCLSFLSCDRGLVTTPPHTCVLRRKCTSHAQRTASVFAASRSSVYCSDCIFWSYCKVESGPQSDWAKSESICKSMGQGFGVLSWVVEKESCERPSPCFKELTVLAARVPRDHPPLIVSWVQASPTHWKPPGNQPSRNCWKLPAYLHWMSPVAKYGCPALRKHSFSLHRHRFCSEDTVRDVLLTLVPC